MDPLTIAAIASSLMGGLFGGSDQQERKSYSGMASPQRTLEDSLKMILGFGSQLEGQGPTRLRSVVPQAPQPVRVPGLDLQIGGGLGMDPAIKDPSMLTAGGGMGNTFSNMASAYGAGGTPPKAGQRGSRSPNLMSTSTDVKQRKPETF
jgi:hypothetical protein